jgi:hypothetical protein
MTWGILAWTRHYRAAAPIRKWDGCERHITKTCLVNLYAFWERLPGGECRLGIVVFRGWLIPSAISNNTASSSED